MEVGYAPRSLFCKVCNSNIDKFQIIACVKKGKWNWTHSECMKIDKDHRKLKPEVAVGFDSLNPAHRRKFVSNFNKAKAAASRANSRTSAAATDGRGRSISKNDSQSKVKAQTLDTQRSSRGRSSIKTTNEVLDKKPGFGILIILDSMSKEKGDGISLRKSPVKKAPSLKDRDDKRLRKGQRRAGDAFKSDDNQSTKRRKIDDLSKNSSTTIKTRAPRSQPNSSTQRTKSTAGKKISPTRATRSASVPHKKDPFLSHNFNEDKREANQSGRLASKLTAKELKEVLRKHNQPISGPKKAQAERVIDGEKRGEIPKCPHCKYGNMKFDHITGVYACVGYYDGPIYHHCQFKSTGIKRKPWKKTGIERKVKL